MKGLKSLSNLIEELIIEGYTIPEIAEQWGFQSTTVAGAFTPSKKGFKYIDFKQPKKEVVELPNGDSITFDRLYTWESLSDLEKLFYEQYKEKLCLKLKREILEKILLLII